jgi:hypothetical protein
MKIFRFSLLLLFILISSCGQPSKDDVASEFMKKHPTYTVLSCGVGEGGYEYAYFHIQYKKPNKDKIYEDIWLYNKEPNGEWKNTNRERSDFKWKK